MATRRQESVGRVLQEAIADVLLREVRDPRIGFVTVVGVEPSVDLRHAKVRISILAESEAQCGECLAGFDSARRFIQKLVAERVRLKYVPELVFVRDRGSENAERVARILNEIAAEQHREGDAGGTP